MKNFALIAMAIGTLCLAGCTKSFAPDRAAGLGQACDTTNDCGGGLVCTAGGICMEANLPLDASANVCVSCLVDADCGSGPFACDEGSCEMNCATDMDCVDYGGSFDNACQVSTGECYEYDCATDLDCGGGYCDLSIGEMGAQGSCRGCNDDTYCAAEETCFEYTCEDTCATDQDCTGFFACDTANSVCEYVGCKTDRECALASPGLVGQLMVCDTDSGLCEVPCSNDAECIALVGGGYCVDGYCADLGCENDDECRVVSGPNSYCVAPTP